MANSMKGVPIEARLLTDRICSEGSVPHEIIIKPEDYFTHMDILNIEDYAAGHDDKKVRSFVYNIIKENLS